MALIEQIGRAQTITVLNNGDRFRLNNTSDESCGGAWQVEFMPGPSFVGSFVILGRNANYQTHDAAVGFMPVPYRRICIDNVARDYALAPDIITGAALILVPANALSLAILVACSSGTCDIFSLPITGPLAL